uniref:Uncharacterized protein n=1 Tax=viral metagenome TaxID=1070528 RepID=A0A6C0CDQ5_9ZZZZ
MDVNNQCLSVFKSFINDIIKVFPEYKIKLEDIYGSIIKLDTCVIDECELLKEFLERVHKLNKRITNKDDNMFVDDPLILTDISFKNIWTNNISYKTKESIWKYLQTFCLISMNYNSNKDLQTALAELSENNQADIKDKNIASDVKKIKKMTDNIKEPIAQDIGDTQISDTQSSVDQSAEPLNPFEQIMNNSEIGKLAEQVSKELDIESMLGGSDSDNPMELFSNLMSGGAMNKIMGTIHNVVNTKVESGELDRDSMTNEAQNMYGQLGQSEMFQQMTQQMGNQPNSKVINQAQDNNPHTSNKTKSRLQKKLKEKQNVQVNKVDN